MSSEIPILDPNVQATNKPVTHQETGSELSLYEDKLLSPEDIKKQVNHIKKLMKAVMREGVHYGKVGFTKNPCLWKAGAEKLLLTFGITVSIEIEDKSNEDCVSYRVKASAIHRQSGTFLGSAYAECSSNEAKYKWRSSICDEEYETTLDSKRRIKFEKKRWKHK